MKSFKILAMTGFPWSVRLTKAALFRRQNGKARQLVYDGPGFSGWDNWQGMRSGIYASYILFYRFRRRKKTK